MFWLLMLIAMVTSLTCQNYHHDKCVSTGCEIHCQGIGKKSGYCGYSGDWCTCYCVSYLDGNIKIEKGANISNVTVGLDLSFNNKSFVDLVENVNFQTSLTSDCCTLRECSICCKTPQYAPYCDNDSNTCICKNIS